MLLVAALGMAGLPLVSASGISGAAAQTVDGALDGTERPLEPGEQAPDARIDAQTAEIGATLRCPICRQQSVAESSSRIARDMQGVIRTMLMEGGTPEEIEAYFVEAYGPWILLRPRAEGINLFVYVGPALAFLAGGLFLARRLQRGRGGRGDGREHRAEPVTVAGGPADGGRVADRVEMPDGTGDRSATQVAAGRQLGGAERDWLEAELREG